MKIFIYGMQSSGASLATYLLGQVPNAVVLVDLYSYQVMPAIDAPDAEHVIGKAVVTTTHSVEDHLRSFRPDRAILFLRDPAQNYVALRRKSYADDDGAIDDKFRRLNQAFLDRHIFDLVLKYEDVVARPELVIRLLRGIGFPATPDLYGFPRSRDEIVDFNLRHCDWCRDRFGRGWSFGNIHGDRMQQTLVHKAVPARVRKSVSALAPAVIGYYESTDAPPPASLSRAAALFRDLIIRPITARATTGAQTMRSLKTSISRRLKAGRRL